MTSSILGKLFYLLKEKSFWGLWEYNRMSCFQKCSKHSSSLQYRHIGLLSFIMKLFVAIIKKRYWLPHKLYNQLSDKMYGFLSDTTSDDILTDIKNRISEALDNKYIRSTIVLDISKAFDRVYHRTLLHKLSRITGKVRFFPNM